MPSSLAVDEHTSARGGAGTRVLFVAWRNPETRTITPVGRLCISREGDGQEFQFQYLAPARSFLARPFASFPRFETTYRSHQLFPFFENRMIPAGTPGFDAAAASVGLGVGADPFEVLASSGGRRATDLLELFPEPEVDRAAGRATFRFLVRGVRHLPGAHDEIDRLRVGDRLHLRPQPDNEVDPRAVLVLPGSGVEIGWAPAYLCDALHRSAAASPAGWDDIGTDVVHIGDRDGPPHFRLLCQVGFPWPFPEGPFDTEEFAVAGG